MRNPLRAGTQRKLGAGVVTPTTIGRAAGRLWAAALGVPLALVSMTGAWAAWSTHGSGGAAGAATTMPAGAAPAGSAVGRSVTVSWPGAGFADSTPVSGYVVHRYDAASHATGTVGAACAGVVGATTCTEQSVPPGTWVYTDVPVQGSWTGGQSPDSAPIVVALT